MKITNRAGTSLIEILIAAGVASVFMFAMMSMQQNQMRSNNYLEFQLKRMQIQNAIVSEVLSDPASCACLFEGAAPFPANPPAPGATLTGPVPNQVGRYHFVTPGVCATATMPRPLVSNEGVDGVKTKSVRLTNIVNVSGAYFGDFEAVVESTKQVLGPQELPIRVPVTVSTTAAGANRNFVSCSMSAPTPTFNTTQEFTINLPVATGEVAPCSTGTDASIAVHPTTGQPCVHNADLNHSRFRTISMNGYSVCFLAGFKTTAGDEDVYDGCLVRQVGPGNWVLEAYKHRWDALLCRALCVP